MYDPKDSRGVPLSTGVPPIVTVSLLALVGLVLALLTTVIVSSGAGHQWPSSKSTDFHMKD
jgi:hypothetical protein